MRPAEWNEIVDLVKRRENRRDEIARVIDTHISAVLLVGARAYKFKRAVVLPFLDLRSVQTRLECCESELALNRRTAPELYLAVLRFTRRAGGGLEVDGEGELVDCCVEMRRFDDGALLSAIPVAELGRPLIESLARQVAKLHKGSDASLDRNGAARLWRVIELVSASLAASRLFLPEDVEALRERLEVEWLRYKNLLDARAARRKVRRGHGDLHLANICLIDGEPTIFDCLEFNEELATTDILYDLAFLLMDLWRRGAKSAANLLLNRYLDELDEADGLALLPLFMALRAAIRAQVLAIQFAEVRPKSDALARQSHEYFSLANELLQPAGSRLVAIGGLSGSGKSTLAEGLAPEIGPPPGARILSSDRLRKELFAVPPEHRLPQSAYTPEMSQIVYGRLMGRAAAALEAGWSVVADAVFDRPADQAALGAIAEEAAVPFAGIWLDAPTETLLKRVAARRNDVSDATPSVVLAQADGLRPESSWHRLPSSDVGDLRDAARRLLGLI